MTTWLPGILTLSGSLYSPYFRLKKSNRNYTLNKVNVVVVDFKQQTLIIYLKTDSHVVFVDNAAFSLIASITAQHKSLGCVGTKANIDTATSPFPR